MDNKNIIKEKLKELFALSKKLSFFDAKLKDGSILRTADEALNKGSKVVLISADGVESEVADGDHTSEDGSVINVKSGVIEAITAPSAEAPAEMAAPAPAPVEGEKAEQSSYDGDMTSLMEIIKNLTDRIAALESSTSDTKMTVEKMSAEPAAKPFNFEPMAEGTIGAALAKYKADHKEKEELRKKQMMEFSSKRKPEAKAQEFKSNSKPNSTEPKPFNFNFGGGFSIEGGK